MKDPTYFKAELAVYRTCIEALDTKIRHLEAELRKSEEEPQPGDITTLEGLPNHFLGWIDHKTSGPLLVGSELRLLKNDSIVTILEILTPPEGTA